MQIQYLEMPTELINQLGENVALTKEMAFAHGVCDKHSNFQHYCTMYEGKRYITTAEQKAQTAEIYAINKAKAIKETANKLVFVGMGMNYQPRYEDDVCNHRIRTEIVNPKGRRFFIEVGTWSDELMRIDFVIDRDQELEYETKAQEYRDKINANGGFLRIGKRDYLYEQYQKYMGQPYYWYKKEQYNSLRTKYTKANIIKLVNELFDCKFTELEIDYYHLRTEDYQSISPKN